MKVIARLLTVLMSMLLAMVISINGASAEGEVNWETSTVTATAIGVYPEKSVNHLQAVQMAKLAATRIAQRDLLATIEGINITSETTVKNMMLEDDTIVTKLSGFLKGSVVVAERELPGGYEVTVQVPLFGGYNSVAPIVMQRPATRTSFPQPVQSVEPAAPVTNINITINNTTNIENTTNSTTNNNTTNVKNTTNNTTNNNTTNVNNNTTNTGINIPSTNPNTPSSTKPSTTKPTTKPVVTVPSTKTYTPSSRAIGGFTGLIVDCRGLGLKPVMSPVVKNENGDPIYGYKNLDYDKIIEIGMAGYTTDPTNVSRAGSNPLVVRAVKIEGATKGNPVISVADANRILIENNSSGFLDKMNVVFLR